MRTFVRRVLILCVMTYLLSGLSSLSLAQQYPRWFLETHMLENRSAVIGYASPFYYQDSSDEHAFINACENYARNKRVHICGGQAFWATEIGTFWMGENFTEKFDSTLADWAMKNLVAADSFQTSGIVVVLVAAGRFTVPGHLQTMIDVSQAQQPQWIEKRERDAQYLTAVGAAPRYYYENSSWIEAEKQARLILARSISQRLRSLTKLDHEFQRITDQQVSVTLRNIEVSRRWLDTRNNIFYVEVRVSDN